MVPLPLARPDHNIRHVGGTLLGSSLLSRLFLAMSDSSNEHAILFVVVTLVDFEL